MAESAGLMSGAPPFPGQAQVTLANWQDPPFNSWAFQHVRELIPTARIARADEPDPGRGGRADRSWPSAAGTALDDQGLLAPGTPTGSGPAPRQIVGEYYGNGMAPGTPHLLMSVSSQ
jgi:hypothetical protein